MKIVELLTESSTLSSLGVDNKFIGKIHKQLRLKHDTKWKPIKTKTQAKEELKSDRAVVAITPDNKAYAFGYFEHPMSGGIRIIFFDPDNDTWMRTDSITKALARVKGKAKYFVSVERKQHMDKSARQYEPDENDGKAEQFLEKVNQVYGDLIKQDAKAAYKQVRNHMHDLLDDEVEIDTSMRGYTPSHHDLNEVKSNMKYLKAMSEEGLRFWNNNQSWGNKGEYGAMTDFFGRSYRYELDSALANFEENQKLTMQKFVKYIRKEIKNVVERATTGNFQEYGKSAEDWKKENK